MPQPTVQWHVVTWSQELPAQNAPRARKAAICKQPSSRTSHASCSIAGSNCRFQTLRNLHGQRKAELHEMPSCAAGSSCVTQPCALYICLCGIALSPQKQSKSRDSSAPAGGSARSMHPLTLCPLERRAVHNTAKDPQACAATAQHKAHLVRASMVHFFSGTPTAVSALPCTAATSARTRSKIAASTPCRCRPAASYVGRSLGDSCERGRRGLGYAAVSAFAPAPARHVLSSLCCRRWHDARSTTLCQRQVQGGAALPPARRHRSWAATQLVCWGAWNDQRDRCNNRHTRPHL